jgi:hypothetical protein
MERPTGSTLQELQGLGPFRLHVQGDREIFECLQEPPEAVSYLASSPANLPRPTDRTGEAITVDRVSP